MQIEIHKSKTKLTKSIVSQMHSANQKEIEWAYTQEATALGYVTTVKGYAKVGIIKGRTDYYLLPIVDTKVTGPHQGSWDESIKNYRTEYHVHAERLNGRATYTFFSEADAKEFHRKLKVLINHCRSVHIYL